MFSQSNLPFFRVLWHLYSLQVHSYSPFSWTLSLLGADLMHLLHFLQVGFGYNGKYILIGQSLYFASGNTLNTAFCILMCFFNDKLHSPAPITEATGRNKFSSFIPSVTPKISQYLFFTDSKCPIFAFSAPISLEVDTVHIDVRVLAGQRLIASVSDVDKVFSPVHWRWKRPPIPQSVSAISSPGAGNTQWWLSRERFFSGKPHGGWQPGRW